MTFGYHFGYNQRFGIELSLFKVDPADFVVNHWEFISFKVLLNLFGLMVCIVGLDIAEGRSCVGLLNCYLAVFYD